jgi:uncharacterized iron-regulated membrane protein
MKNGFRQSMAWLHTWAGLVLGWVLFFMFLTGTAGYFDTEIDRWMQPERPLVTRQVPVAEAVSIAITRLNELAPGAEQWNINPPGSRDNPDLRIFYRLPAGADGKRGATGNERLDAQTGQRLEYRDTGGGQLLYRMHYRLHYLPTGLTEWLIGVCTMFMLVAIVSGVIVHKKIFKDFFTFRPGKQQRSWLDAHNVLSVVALPFHVMITYSGLIFFALTYMPWAVNANYGTDEKARQQFIEEAFARNADGEASGVAAPLAPIAPMLAEATHRWGRDQIRFVEVRNPGDANARVTVARVPSSPLRNVERLTFDGVSGQLLPGVQSVVSGAQATRDVFLGLHEGLFAGIGLRWLYFLSALTGTAMIGTGLVLWTSKRRTQQLKQAHFNISLRIVERLNVGTVIGLPIGICAFFWANRLLPVDFSERAAWEAHAMFIVWGLMLVHAVLRPVANAWIEQFTIAAAACLLLPVLNALTTDRHLGITLAHGDWVLAGFDLTILALGIVFALSALKLRAKLAGSRVRETFLFANS